ncbi:MAG TPA: RsbRD N-terminal domain-containing protein, partial [Sandaracinaceae bacterium]
MTQLEPTPEPDTLARYIREHHEDILRDWRAAVARLPRNQTLTQARVLDAIPEMLGAITSLLERGDVAALGELELSEHALDRRRASYDLVHVISEFVLLRECILARWERERRSSSVREQRLLDLAIDRAVLGATDFYVKTAVGVLRTLDHVSNETLDAASVDEAFERLVHAMIDATPSADACAVLLRDDGTLRLRASVGFSEMLPPDYA